jgi:hypothetical protein
MKRYLNSVSAFARAALPHFEERLRCLCQRKGRPVLHGEIALEVGCSLEQVTREMERLLDVGAYRRVEESELRARAIEPRVIAYALVK